MKLEIYEKNYNNTSITIDTDIWTNDKINGVAKLMMALYRKMTKDGQVDIPNMTIRQAQILSTHKKDLIYNQEKLVKRGFITIYKDDVQGEMLKFHYKKEINKQRTLVNNNNTLF